MPPRQVLLIWQALKDRNSSISELREPKPKFRFKSRRNDEQILSALNRNYLSPSLCPSSMVRNLSAALESVILQTYRNLKIVVVNDASTDETQATLVVLTFAGTKLR